MRNSDTLWISAQLTVPFKKHYVKIKNSLKMIPFPLWTDGQNYIHETFFIGFFVLFCFLYFGKVAWNHFTIGLQKLLMCYAALNQFSNITKQPGGSDLAPTGHINPFCICLFGSRTLIVCLFFILTLSSKINKICSLV